MSYFIIYVLHNLFHTGTIYFQQSDLNIILTAFCEFSAASALFMYPALSLYYERALQIYTYEKADGYGKACDLVLQGFLRHMCLAIVPVVLSTVLLYFMVRHYKDVLETMFSYCIAV